MTEPTFSSLKINLTSTLRKAAVSTVDVIGRKMWLLQLLIRARDCSTAAKK
jgi:hypothetical protein